MNIFETYIRRHSGDYQAKKDEVTSFIRNQKDDLDNELLEGYTIDDLDSSSVKAYKAKLLERYLESGLDTKIEEEFFRGAKSNPRNSILVSLFTRMGTAERAGSGSQKIQNIVIKNNFKEPELETNIEETKLKLWTVQPAEVYPELSDVEQVIYNIISDTDDIKGLSKKNIQDMLKDNNEYTVKAALNRLTSLKLIEKVGGNRNRTYRRVMSTLEIHEFNSRVS